MTVTPAEAIEVVIVGQGIIGVSTALAIKQAWPNAKLKLYADRPFEEICSYGPAGIFRLDSHANRPWARATFYHFAALERSIGPKSTGIKLLSGHLQSDNRALLENAEACMADIVYNFRWLDDRELRAINPKPSKYCVHFTAYGAEGRTYVPWMMERLRENGSVSFQRRKIDSLQQLVDETEHPPRVIVNCAGLNGGKLAGDDDTCYPNRGVAIEVNAPWHKHFHYKDVDSFTIPMNNSVILGTLKQDNRWDLAITDADRKEIWDKYLDFHPTFKDAEIISEWSGLRPARPTVRLEKVNAHSASGRNCTIIHNYGHGSNGFTMSWGCALNVVELIKQSIDDDRRGSKI